MKKQIVYYMKWRTCIDMSNTNASEENVESPSTYGNEAYTQHRKEEKKKQERMKDVPLQPKDSDTL
jgi:hypothetical protein